MDEKRGKGEGETRDQRMRGHLACERPRLFVQYLMLSISCLMCVVSRGHESAQEAPSVPDQCPFIDSR